MHRHVERELARAQRPCRASARPVLLTAILDPLLRTMRQLPRGDEIAWNTEIDPALALKVNPNAMAEILGNLLDNGRARMYVSIAGSAMTAWSSRLPMTAPASAPPMPGRSVAAANALT